MDMDLHIYIYIYIYIYISLCDEKRASTKSKKEMESSRKAVANSRFAIRSASICRSKQAPRCADYLRPPPVFNERGERRVSIFCRN